MFSTQSTVCETHSFACCLLVVTAPTRWAKSTLGLQNFGILKLCGSVCGWQGWTSTPQFFIALMLIDAWIAWGIARSFTRGVTVAYPISVKKTPLCTCALWNVRVWIIAWPTNARGNSSNVKEVRKQHHGPTFDYSSCGGQFIHIANTAFLSKV